MKILDAEVVIGHDKMDLDIQTAFGADLMSDVLAFARPKSLLITGVTNPQSVRTAYAQDIAAILLCRGKMPSKQAIDIARELEIPLLRTRYILFETCGRLYQAGMTGCIREVCSPETDETHDK
ncbi:MAG: DRTGG domain-containing protein [Thermodesulfobacteriota bacterium]|nr:DRTGG domain-containing protein [Thermodesulfobacteriota bacterium]